MRKNPFVLLAVGLSLIFALNCTRVGPAHVGIEVSKAGSARGVQDIPIRTGWVFYNPLATEIIEYPAFVQTAIWTKDHTEGKAQNEEISFNSKDGLTFYADVNMSYTMSPDKVPAFYLKYKADEIETFTHGQLRQVARDEFGNLAGTYTAEEIFGEKREEFVGKVRAKIQDNFKELGLKIEALGFANVMRPPQQFVDAINSKLAAKQKAEQSKNELAQSTAEAAKWVAQAKGEADANEIKARSITPAIIQWRQLDMQQQWISRWNGQMPQYQMGNAPVPTFDVRK